MKLFYVLGGLLVSLALIWVAQSIWVKSPVAKRSLIEQELRKRVKQVNEFWVAKGRIPTSMEEVGMSAASPETLDIVCGEKNKPYVGIARLSLTEGFAGAYILYVRVPQGNYIYVMSSDGILLQIPRGGGK